MGISDKEKAGAAAMMCGGLCFAIVIVFISVLAASFERISITEVALLYDNYALQLNTDTLYEAGRHYIRPGYSFKKFPNTEQTLIFSSTIYDERQTKDIDFDETEFIFPTIRTRSNEGLIVYLDFVINFKLTVSDDKTERAYQLASLYRSFGDDWYRAVYYLTKADARDAAAEYEAFDFFEKREEIAEKIKETLEESLYSLNITLMTINVVNLEFPDEFNNAILDTEITVQETEQYEYILDATEIEAETDIISAEYDAEMLLNTAETDAEAYLMEEEAYADAYSYRIEKLQSSVSELITELDFDDSDEGTIASKVNTIMWITYLRTQASEKMTFGSNTPSLLKED